jgi:hypothetical protein
MASFQTYNPKREAKEREFDKDTWRTEDVSRENTSRHSILSDQQQEPQPNAPPRTVRASISPLPEGLVGSSAPGGVSPGITPSDISPSTADGNDVNARGSSDLIADLDTIDEPTIVVEVC